MTTEDNRKVALAAQNKAIGDQFFDDGNFEEAIKFYTIAISFDPTDCRLFGNRSLCFYNLDQFEASLNDADKSLQLDSRYAKGFVRKFRSLYRLGRIDEADKAFSTACQLHPEYQDEFAASRCRALMNLPDDPETTPHQVEQQSASGGILQNVAKCLRRRCHTDDHHSSDSADESTEATVVERDNSDKHDNDNCAIRKREIQRY